MADSGVGVARDGGEKIVPSASQSALLLSHFLCPVFQQCPCLEAILEHA
jgi:hypothetical protein